MYTYFLKPLVKMKNAIGFSKIQIRKEENRWRIQEKDDKKREGEYLFINFASNILSALIID